MKRFLISVSCFALAMLFAGNTAQAQNSFNNPFNPSTQPLAWANRQASGGQNTNPLVILNQYNRATGGPAAAPNRYAGNPWANTMSPRNWNSSTYYGPGYSSTYGNGPNGPFNVQSYYGSGYSSNTYGYGTPYPTYGPTSGYGYGGYGWGAGY